MRELCTSDYIYSRTHKGTSGTGSDWFKTALEKILVIDVEHDRQCQRACLDCLLTFDLQMAYEDGKLNRKKAVSNLRSLLGQ